MKLRNKKTGEIRDGEDVIIENLRKNGSTLEAINLEEIREDWEDYEESTGYWYIDFDGDILSCVEDFDEETDEERKSIGNYFETKEEAERAVEKLKAWKRLKDKGFRFGGISNYKISFEFEERVMKKGEVFAPQKDLNLLFGGEK